MMKSELDGIRRRNQEKDLTYEGNMNEEDHLKTLREMLSQCKRASVAVGGQSNIEDAAREESSRFAKSIRFAISAIERSQWVAVESADDLPKVDGLYVWATATSGKVNYLVADYYVSYKDSWHISAKQSWFPIEPYTPKEQI